MKRNDTCIDIDVTDKSLLGALASLPDRCRSLNPFLRCTVGVEGEKNVLKRLRRQRSDIAIVCAQTKTLRAIACLSVGDYSIIWRSKDASDPKRAWIVGLIADMLKQNVVHGEDDVI